MGSCNGVSQRGNTMGSRHAPFCYSYSTNKKVVKPSGVAQTAGCAGTDHLHMLEVVGSNPPCDSQIFCFFFHFSCVFLTTVYIIQPTVSWRYGTPSPIHFHYKAACATTTGHHNITIPTTWLLPRLSYIASQSPLEALTFHSHTSLLTSEFSLFLAHLDLAVHKPAKPGVWDKVRSKNAPIFGIVMGAFQKRHVWRGNHKSK